MNFWAGKRVLITGHTGFKGAWAARWLSKLGAEVTGISLAPETEQSLFSILGESHMAASHIADLRDPEMTAALVTDAKPEIVFHMAAQPLVRTSYADPVSTFGSNVMGTVHLLDALRKYAKPEAIIAITSDKVYENDGTNTAYREEDRLGGHDPYSASKAATEIVVSSYRRSFFAETGVPIVTARGGNVIGGGDFSSDRIVPDLVRAIMGGQAPEIRNPMATRPWQHVLDCLYGYFSFAEALSTGKSMPDALNFGPRAGDPSVTVGELANSFMSEMGRPAIFQDTVDQGPHEMAFLSIDPSLAMRLLGWHPQFESLETIKLTAQWYAGFISRQNMTEITDSQIDAFQGTLR